MYGDPGGCGIVGNDQHCRVDSMHEVVCYVRGGRVMVGAAIFKAILH